MERCRWTSFCGEVVYMLMFRLAEDTVVPGVNGLYPPYFIYGPIVFSKATQASAIRN